MRKLPIGKSIACLSVLPAVSWLGSRDTGPGLNSPKMIILEEVRWSNPNTPDMKVQLDRASDHRPLEFAIK